MNEKLFKPLQSDFTNFNAKKNIYCIPTTSFANSQLPPPDYHLQTPNSQLQTPNSQLQTPNSPHLLSLIVLIADPSIR